MIVGERVGSLWKRGSLWKVWGDCGREGGVTVEEGIPVESMG